MTTVNLHSLYTKLTELPDVIGKFELGDGVISWDYDDCLVLISYDKVEKHTSSKLSHFHPNSEEEIIAYVKKESAAIKKFYPNSTLTFFSSLMVAVAVISFVICLVFWAKGNSAGAIGIAAFGVVLIGLFGIVLLSEATRWISVSDKELNLHQGFTLSDPNGKERIVLKRKILKFENISAARIRTVKGDGLFISDSHFCCFICDDGHTYTLPLQGQGKKQIEKLEKTLADRGYTL